jgi:hypothetical protein
MGTRATSWILEGATVAEPASWATTVTMHEQAAVKVWTIEVALSPVMPAEPEVDAATGEPSPKFQVYLKAVTREVVGYVLA